MLILPVGIVALLFSFIVGPFTFSQNYQARRKLLGQRFRQRLSLLRARHYPAFELQGHPAAFEATTFKALPIAWVETATTPHGGTTSFPAPPQTYAEIIIPEAQSNDQPFTATPQPFVVASRFQGPFCWRDLLNYRVFKVLTVVVVSFWFPLVAIPFIPRLFSHSEPLDKIGPPVDQPPILLPPKYLTLSTMMPIRISDRRTYALPEPIFSSAPPEVPPFWLVSEEKEQDRPPPPSLPLLRLLRLPFLETESQKPLSPLSSPADSGYGTTLPDAAPGVSLPASDKSATITPEHLGGPLLTSGAESIHAHYSDNTTTASGHSTGENNGVAGSDTELEDDDDGSTTVTNSTVDLTSLIPRPPPVSVEDLAAKLKSATTALIEGAKPRSEPIFEKPSILGTLLDHAAKEPPHDEPAVDLPSNDEPAVDLGTTDEDLVLEEISVEIFPPSEPCSDAIGTTPDTACVCDRVTAGTGLEGEPVAEDVLPSQDDSEYVEPWTPGGEIPVIIITPPSEVDPEDFALQVDMEGEQEESEDVVNSNCNKDPKFDHDCELGCTGGYPDESVTEVAPVSPPSPVMEAPFRSPITTSGLLWSDDEGDDPGPLPSFQTEIQSPPASEEKMSGTTMDICEDSNVIEEPMVETAPEHVEEQQPAPEALALEASEPVPAIPVPSSSPAPNFESPRDSRPVRVQPSVNTEDHGKGSSRSSRTSIPRHLQYFHCCYLYKPDGRPKSWKSWEMKKDCIPHKSHLQESQFVAPTDMDGEHPTTRIAIDNLDATRFSKVDGIPSYNYLTEALVFFATKHTQCWSGRMVDGIEYPSVGYATVDFDSLDEAIRMFKELQGRRIRGHTWHWRLEFVDPEDETHGGRRVVRTGLVPDSVKQALAAELEASTKGHRRPKPSNDIRNETGVAARPPARTRPQLSVPGRSLFAGAMATVVQDRRAGGRPAQSSARAPPRRPHRS